MLKVAVTIRNNVTSLVQRKCCNSQENVHDQKDFKSAKLRNKLKPCYSSEGSGFTQQ